MPSTESIFHDRRSRDRRRNPAGERTSDVKKTICLTLALMAFQAQAKDNYAPGFLKKVGEINGAEILEQAPLRGPVNWISPENKEKMMIEGVQMVAEMEDQIRQAVTFDAFGTAYLVFIRLGHKMKVRISKEFGAREGHFIARGQPYLISQGQLFGVDDSWLKEKMAQLGPMDKKHAWAVAKGASLGIATLVVGYIAHYVGLGHAVAPLLLAPMAGFSWYAWLRRGRFAESQMELGYAGNRFSKKILSNVVSYTKPTPTGDVNLVVRNPDGTTRQTSISELTAKGVIKYRNKDCVDYFSKIRTAPFPQIDLGATAE